jgi:phytoene dehydrogenase-like protein
VTRYDAVVVGAGPNGLAAAIELARNGLSVHVVEANDTVGGAARTEASTLPGFLHDVGSAIHPLGVGSPFLARLPLQEHGLDWVHAHEPLAHPLDGGRVALLSRDLARTSRSLDEDAGTYRRLIEPFVRRWEDFVQHVLDSPARVPRNPTLMARFAPTALLPTTALARPFRTVEARALLAGNAAHSGSPLGAPLSAAVGVTLMVAAHAVGWPFPRGGAGSITRAMASYLRAMGGTIETGRPVRSLRELPERRATLLALTHRQVATIAADALPRSYRRRLEAWQYGPGAFKVDWALDGPIPWQAHETGQAATVHVGGTLEDIRASEREPGRGRVAERPFVLLAQPSVFDRSRAPSGKHTAWAYCHVPNGWQGDATDRIEAQIERFAPGFRDLVLARRVHAPADLESWDANLVGGDVNGGALTVQQVIGPRRWSRHPWSTPVPHLYVCSASRPPGGGVHGMVGYHAAREALNRTFGVPDERV